MVLFCLSRFISILSNSTAAIKISNKKEEDKSSIDEDSNTDMEISNKKEEDKSSIDEIDNSADII